MKKVNKVKEYLNIIENLIDYGVSLQNLRWHLFFLHIYIIGNKNRICG